MSHLNKIFVQLGLQKGNGLFITSEGTWQIENTFANRVERLIYQKIKPDAFFCLDNKPFILFTKTPQINPICIKLFGILTSLLL